jgi:predicted HAD superfamily Cof-like phosphohydrolase
MTVQEQVKEFHEAFKLGMNDRPTMISWPLEVMRETILLEEVTEYHDALNMPRGQGPRNRMVEIADALGDIVYIAYGTAIEYGIDLDAVIAEIHRSNMSKLGPDGQPIYRKDGKVLKGPDYEPPRLKEVLYGGS